MQFRRKETGRHAWLMPFAMITSKLWYVLEWYIAQAIRKYFLSFFVTRDPCKGLDLTSLFSTISRSVLAPFNETNSIGFHQIKIKISWHASVHTFVDKLCVRWIERVINTMPIKEEIVWILQRLSLHKTDYFIRYMTSRNSMIDCWRKFYFWYVDIMKTKKNYV